MAAVNEAYEVLSNPGAYYLSPASPSAFSPPRPCRAAAALRQRRGPERPDGAAGRTPVPAGRAPLLAVLPAGRVPRPRGRRRRIPVPLQPRALGVRVRVRVRRVQEPYGACARGPRVDVDAGGVRLSNLGPADIYFTHVLLYTCGCRSAGRRECSKIVYCLTTSLECYICVLVFWLFDLRASKWTNLMKHGPRWFWASSP
ncbi:hypothetical protein B0H19DRAFT_300427 [Mycena capillaripes]|nr:hypothetical protein B0H19DRAFT_300427 [Mycena capillaripes]